MRIENIYPLLYTRSRLLEYREVITPFKDNTLHKTVQGLFNDKIKPGEVRVVKKTVDGAPWTILIGGREDLTGKDLGLSGVERFHMVNNAMGEEGDKFSIAENGPVFDCVLPENRPIGAYRGIAVQGDIDVSGISADDIRDFHRQHLTSYYRKFHTAYPYEQKEWPKRDIGPLTFSSVSPPAFLR